VRCDAEGAELPHDGAARNEAVPIIRDLKKNDENAWKSWKMDVVEGDRQVWQIHFIEVAC
jgi:hypothetical protein